MNVRNITALAATTLGVAAVAAAVVVQGTPDSGDVAGPGMSTGVTVTADTPPSEAPVLQAVPEIKGPAPLPPEEQGLPG